MSPFNYFQVVINPKFPDMIMMLMIDNKDNKTVSLIFYWFLQILYEDKKPATYQHFLWKHLYFIIFIQPKFFWVKILPTFWIRYSWNFEGVISLYELQYFFSLVTKIILVQLFLNIKFNFTELPYHYAEIYIYIQEEILSLAYWHSACQTTIDK